MSTRTKTSPQRKSVMRRTGVVAQSLRVLTNTTETGRGHRTGESHPQNQDMGVTPRPGQEEGHGHPADQGLLDGDHLAEGQGPLGKDPLLLEEDLPPQGVDLHLQNEEVQLAGLHRLADLLDHLRGKRKREKSPAQKKVQAAQRMKKKKLLKTAHLQRKEEFRKDEITENMMIVGKIQVPPQRSRAMKVYLHPHLWTGDEKDLAEFPHPLCDAIELLKVIGEEVLFQRGIILPLQGEGEAHRQGVDLHLEDIHLPGGDAGHHSLQQEEECHLHPEDANQVDPHLLLPENVCIHQQPPHLRPNKGKILLSQARKKAHRLAPKMKHRPLPAKFNYPNLKNLSRKKEQPQLKKKKNRPLGLRVKILRNRKDHRHPKRRARGH